jgi:hypothetical protein
VGKQIGKLRTVLPSSFQGSARNMRAEFRDATAMCRALGKPDYFVTFTCNPNWPEVQDALQRGQVANDRPDILARVFRLKVEELLDDLLKRQVLGRVIGYMQVIEFQKVRMYDIILLIYF